MCHFPCIHDKFHLFSPRVLNTLQVSALQVLRYLSVRSSACCQARPRTTRGPFNFLKIQQLDSNPGVLLPASIMCLIFWILRLSMSLKGRLPTRTCAPSGRRCGIRAHNVASQIRSTTRKMILEPLVSCVPSNTYACATVSR